MIELGLLFLIGLAVLALFCAGGIAKMQEPDRWPEPTLGTADDPRCQRLLRAQYMLAAKMKREGKSLLTGRAYKPTLTIQQQPAPRANKVVPIRRKP